jgi:hypothetical protein
MVTLDAKNCQFIRISGGESPIYQLFPSLSLIESAPSIQILKVLKAICKSCVS